MPGPVAVRGPADFASLYYTDCRPGQGLGGGAGFQFQACSDGVGDAEQRLVARGALYEVPTRWMRERRAVGDYPRSLAHLAELPESGDDTEDAANTERTIFVTAAGRYLGQEANGYRDGNQFTHAVVTRDPGSYGLLRPAQLWDAPWWSGEPAPTTTCPSVPAPPEDGAWDTEAVRDRIAADPRGDARLGALVSAMVALRDPERRRILLITEDGGEAACWIAAATLLLDRQRALEVGFKIFVTDPDRSPQDVLVVHPEFADPYRRGDGYVVFDLADGLVPEVPVAPEAAFWVPRWLGGDVYDVVDAVELAGGLARERRAGGRDALDGVERDIAALTVGVDDSDDAAPETVHRVAAWLASAGPVAADLVGPGAVAPLAASSPDAATLRAFDAVTADRCEASRQGRADPGWEATAVDVRRQLFTAETSSEMSSGVSSEVGGDGALEVAEVRTVTGSRSAAGSPSAADPSDVADRRARVPRLLAVPLDAAELADRHTALHRLAADRPLAAMTLADRHRLHPPSSLVARFATWWAAHPEREADTRSWAAGTEVVGALCEELARRLADPRTQVATARDVRARWWRLPDELWRSIPILGATPVGPSRLDLEVTRGAFDGSDGSDEPRQVALSRYTAAVSAPAPQAPDPSRAPDPWVTTWRHVFDGRVVDNLAVHRFLAATPPERRTRELAALAYDVLTRALAFDDDARRALELLEDVGLPPRELGHLNWPPVDPALAEVLARLTQGARVDEAAAIGRRLAESTNPARQHREELAELLLTVSPSVAGRVLVSTGGTSLRDKTLLPRYADRAAGNRKEPPDVRALLLLFVFAVKSFTDRPKEGKRWLHDLQGAVRALGRDGVRRATEDLLADRELPDDDGVRERWVSWLGELGFPVRIAGVPAGHGAEPTAPTAPAEPGRRIGRLFGTRRRG